MTAFRVDGSGRDRFIASLKPVPSSGPARVRDDGSVGSGSFYVGDEGSPISQITSSVGETKVFANTGAIEFKNRRWSICGVLTRKQIEPTLGEYGLVTASVKLGGNDKGLVIPTLGVRITHQKATEEERKALRDILGRVRGR